LICGDCGERAATVRYTEMRDGELYAVRLCEECARKRGVGAGLSSFAGPLVNILMGLLADSMEQGGESRGVVDCPQCGTSYSDFRASGRLGCAGCYEAFGEELKPLLRRVHGSTRHIGRCPAGDAEDASRRAELRRLRAELRAAVRREDYETAAELRDQIRSSEREQAACRAAGESWRDGYRPGEKAEHVDD